MNTFHPRRDWVEASYPVSGPVVNWPAIDTIVPHYTAAADLPDGDMDEFDYDIAPYLRAMQRDYVNNRGYSVGYWWAVDWLGGIWQLRGFDPSTGGGALKSAANKDHNEHTVPVLFLVDGADRPTLEAEAAFRALNWAVQHHPSRGRVNRLAVVDHGRLQAPNHPTACAGAGIRWAVDQGRLSADYTPPTTKEDTMIVLHVICKDDAAKPELVVWVDGSGASLLGLSTPADADAVVSAEKAVRCEVSSAQYEEFVALARTGDGTPS